jgi:F0F1-type ATP synthase membrane subunit c/vacuolar-type H+-ATPase subunit K
MSAMVEAFIVAALAGMVAGVSVGYINRKVLKIKLRRRKAKLMKMRRAAPPYSSDSDVRERPT